MTKLFESLKDQMRKRLFEIIWILLNFILIGIYFYDKLGIRCEPCPCLDINDCPPCQTDFMKNFWLYIIITNTIFIIGFLLKKKLKK